MLTLNVKTLFGNHSGTVWFDDLFVGEVGSDKNFVTNPSFEENASDGAAGWKKHPEYSVDNSVSRSGSTSLRCEIPKPSGSGPAMDSLDSAFGTALAGEEDRIETDAPVTVFVRPVKKDNQIIVQLLNLDCGGGIDGINEVKPFRLSVKLDRDFKGLEGPVILSSPDRGETDAEIEYAVRNGRVEMRIPGLHVWSIVHFKVKE